LLSVSSYFDSICSEHNIISLVHHLMWPYTFVYLSVALFVQKIHRKENITVRISCVKYLVISVTITAKKGHKAQQKI
jgi:hypothetical protein